MRRSLEMSGGPRRRALALLTAVALAFGWLVVGSSVVAMADGPTTFSNTASIAVPATGSTNQVGPASPYPSNITVSGMAGPVTKVTVALRNVTHSTLNDIDALLVSPTGQSLVFLSDIGDPTTLAFVNNATLTFDDAAAGLVPTGNVPSGTYRPTNTTGTDSFPAPAPTPSNQTTLAGAFTGIDPNGTWQLYVVDDATGDIGTIAGGWSLTLTTEVAAVATTTTVATSDATTTTGDPVTFTATIRAGAAPVTSGSVQFAVDGTNLGAPAALSASGTAALTTSTLTEGTHLVRATYGGATGFLTSNGTVSQRVDNATVVTGSTFCNTGTIGVPMVGTAAPYPSNVTVSGLAGQVTKVTATLKGVSHQAPIDLDILLSGPTPTTNTLLMSDSGGQNPVSGLDLTFDDAAPGGVPIPLVSGSYQPTNAADGAPADAFPAPAPARSGATTLATFNGASGNGQWSLWVVDDATGDSGSIAGGWCLTITSQSPTTTTLTSAPNPSTVGASVTLTATVTSGGSPVTTGTVQFADGATALGAPVAVSATGTATLTTAALGVGTHSLTATYGGTATLAASSGSVSQVVNRAASGTTLTSSSNPSTPGASVTFTATVTSGGSPVTSGTVQFADGATPLGAPVALAADGTAALTTSTLTSGSHSMTAAFAGTATIAPSSGSLTQVVAILPTTTTLTSGLNPSTFGDPVTFTATVVSAGTPVGAGTVTFAVDGTPAGTVALAADGTATLTTSTLTAGTHAVTATYSGTPTYGSSASATLTQVVEQAATSTTVTSSSNPSILGDSVTFTATVDTGGSPVTTGTVQFSDGATPLGAAVSMAADGTAALTTSALTAGTHTITAVYSGTANLTTSTGSVEQVVDALTTTTMLASTPNPSNDGAAVTLTATVTSSGSPVAEGTVQFTDGASLIGSPVAVAADGTAGLTTTTLAVGSHTLGATYLGTASYAGSASGPLTQVVRPVADAGGPYAVAEGGTLALDGSGSSAGATYAWDVDGDGDFTDASGSAPALTWAQLEALGIDDGPATYTVTLRVTAGSLDATDTAVLTVTNTPPVAVVTGDLTATVGEPFTVKVGADDASSADLAALFTYTVDWGDGSPVETLTGPADPPVTHTYTAPGSFDAAFTAADKDGGVSGPTGVVVLAVPAPPPTTTVTTTTTTTTTTTSTTSTTGTTSTTSGTGTTTSSTGSTPPTTTDDGLAHTGADPTPLVLLAVLLLLAGAVLAGLARRPRGTHG